jgi:hypothetical protein
MVNGYHAWLILLHENDINVHLEAKNDYDVNATA